VLTTVPDSSWNKGGLFLREGMQEGEQEERGGKEKGGEGRGMEWRGHSRLYLEIFLRIAYASELHV